MGRHGVEHSSSQVVAREVLAPLLRDALDGVHHGVEAGLSQGRDEADRRERGELEPLLHLARRGLLVQAHLPGDIPLVDREHDPLVGVEDVAGNVRVLRGGEFGRVEHENGNVRAVDCPDGAKRTVSLDARLDTAPPSEPRRVDDQGSGVSVRDERVYRIPGGPRNLAHDGALLPDERVKQHRLACIRAAN